MDEIAPGHHRFNCGYFEVALNNLGDVIKRAAKTLADVEFDTLVGTGMSGALVVPALALAMGKSFVLVRKENDGSHHHGKLIGNLGKRWVFVDDFVSSGMTRERVFDTITEQAKRHNHPTEYVGDYCYARMTKYGCRCKAKVCSHQGVFTPSTR